MEEYKGKKVPVKPESAWEWWMKDPAIGCGCCLTDKCYGILCEDCIYSVSNAALRKSFYEDTFCKKASRRFMGLEMPVQPERGWKWMRSEKVCGRVNECELVSHNCADCIYSMHNQERRKECYAHFFPDEVVKPRKLNRDSKGRFCKRGVKLPKLTAEVFNRPDCPDWAEWAAVDASGAAYWYEERPSTPELFCHTRWHPVRLGSKIQGCSGRFDASDWEHSLIQRPAKELPDLTQTAFHCPDCPKEATTLKVFPANHVVALDKDDKVLKIMDLQCKEGEVKRFEWVYSRSAYRVYCKDDYRQDIPVDAVPIQIAFYSPELLVGKAVRNIKTGSDYLVSAVDGLTITLQGVAKRELLSMPTFVQFYRFTASRHLCCNFKFV